MTITGILSEIRRSTASALLPYNKGGSTASFYYTYDAENRTITLMDPQGSVAGVLRPMEIDGKLGYMIYNASADVSYTLADGSVLKLDGIRTATYTKGGKTVSGFFSEKKSASGGTILSFTDADGVLHNFMITVTTKDVLVDPTNPRRRHQAGTGYHGGGAVCGLYRVLLQGCEGYLLCTALRL